MRGHKLCGWSAISSRCERNIKTHSPPLFDAPRQWSCESRRINQHVSTLLRGPHNQVRPRSKACFRREPAEIDVVHDVHRKCFQRLERALRCDTVPIDAVGQATRAMNAQLMPFARILRLPVDA